MCTLLFVYSEGMDNSLSDFMYFRSDDPAFNITVMHFKPLEKYILLLYLNTLQQT